MVINYYDDSLDTISVLSSSLKRRRLKTFTQKQYNIGALLEHYYISVEVYSPGPLLLLEMKQQRFGSLYVQDLLTANQMLNELKRLHSIIWSIVTPGFKSELNLPPSLMPLIPKSKKLTVKLELFLVWSFSHMTKLYITTSLGLKTSRKRPPLIFKHRHPRSWWRRWSKMLFKGRV